MWLLIFASVFFPLQVHTRKKCLHSSLTIRRIWGHREAPSGTRVQGTETNTGASSAVGQGGREPGTKGRALGPVWSTLRWSPAQCPGVRGCIMYPSLGSQQCPRLRHICQSMMEQCCVTSLAGHVAVGGTLNAVHLQ